MTKIPGLLLALSLCACSSSQSPSADPSVAQGPKLAVPQAQLDAALVCTTDLGTAKRDPVLLTPAFSDDQESFGWNYLRQLPALGIPACSLSIPDDGFGDLQNAAEYVVNAVRSMSAQGGRKIIVFGHQHGPLDELWALTFWPDLATKVSAFISLATPYHGTAEAAAACNLGHLCPPSVWQIATGSQFLAALARQPLPQGPTYVSIATQFDELIVPQPETSMLAGATNIELQDICPLRPIEHFTILADNLAYQLVLQVLDHPEQAPDPALLPAGICLDALYMPGTLTPQSSISILQGLAGFGTGFVLAFPKQGVNAEPELRDYAR